MDITATSPVPAFANCTTDVNSEGNGQTNLRMSWRPIKETADAVEAVVVNRGGCTLDVGFRRLQKFKVRPGEKLRWEALSAKSRRGKTPDPQSGTVVVDRDGLIVLKKLTIK